MEEVDNILEEIPKASKRKRRKAKVRWGRRKKKLMGDQTQDSGPPAKEIQDKPVNKPEELMSKIIEKDPNLKFKREQKGKQVNYLDLTLKMEEGKFSIDIYRKDTHTWDIPYWRSRATFQHKKSKILPLLVRAHRVLKDSATKG